MSDPSPVIDLLGGGEHLAARVEVNGLKVVILALETHDCVDSAFTRWVVDGSVRLLETLRTLMSSAPMGDPARIVVIVAADPAMPPTASASMEAAAAAVEGVVQALTLELGPRLRLNAIKCSAAPSSVLEDTLALLASEDGGFLAGSTFTLPEEA